MCLYWSNSVKIFLNSVTCYRNWHYLKPYEMWHFRAARTIQLKLNGLQSDPLFQSKLEIGIDSWKLLPWHWIFLALKLHLYLKVHKYVNALSQLWRAIKLLHKNRLTGAAFGIYYKCLCYHWKMTLRNLFLHMKCPKCSL